MASIDLPSSAAASPKSTQDHVGGLSSTPAVIVLDLKLPRIDGLEVLRRLRADADTRSKRAPVGLLTTSREQPDIYEGYNLGANSYHRKPLDFEKFSRFVGRLGLYWRGLNQPIESVEH